MKNTPIIYGPGLKRGQRRPAVPGPIESGRGIRTAGRLVWPWLAIILVLAVAAAAARPVDGFSIDDSLTNGTPFDRSDDLLDAA